MLYLQRSGSLDSILAVSSNIPGRLPSSQKHGVLLSLLYRPYCGAHRASTYLNADAQKQTDPSPAGCGFLGLSVILALSLPEILPAVDLQRSGEDTNEISSVATSFGQEVLSKSDDRRGSWFTRNKHLFNFVIKDKVLSTLFVTFLISKVGRQSTNILFQYVSKRCGWTLAHVS